MNCLHGEVTAFGCDQRQIIQLKRMVNTDKADDKIVNRHLMKVSEKIIFDWLQIIVIHIFNNYSFLFFKQLYNLEKMQRIGYFSHVYFITNVRVQIYVKK